MDKDIREARDKAVEALTAAIGFWGIDPLEARIYGALFLSPRPMTHKELAAELGPDAVDVDGKLKVLERLGAVKEIAADSSAGKYYEAESDFFQILQTVLKERRGQEMGRALQEICDQRAYVEYRFDEEGNPEDEFLARRLEKLEGMIHLIDKAMFGLRALANVRGLFKRR
jgi:DNA-binding transcriptional regulator GbsR (MarR family)